MKEKSQISQIQEQIADLHTLQAIAILRFLSNDIENRINQLRSLRVMPLGPVVSSTGLSEDEIIRPEDLTVLPRSDAVHGPGLEIHENGSGNVPSARSFVVVDVDPLELEIGRPSFVAAGRIDAVLVAYHLPELGPNLVAALASLDVKDLSHSSSSSSARVSARVSEGEEERGREERIYIEAGAVKIE